jgi:acetyl esterase
MKYFWGMYCKKPGDLQNPLASLDLADHRNLPPALIVTAEYDPLKREADNYAKALRRSGITVDELCLSKAVHGCLFIPPYDMKQKQVWVNAIFNYTF